jgi:ketosteroid isomerase-like protein
MIGITGFLLIQMISVGSAVDLDKERAAIMKTDQEWAKAAAEAKDIDRIASFWADDARIFAPGMAVIVGKQAIRQFLQNSLATPGFSIHWETKDVVLSSDGSMAYATGTNQTTINDKNGKQITIQGKAVTVWRKDPSGAWKCMIDIWNENPPETQ